MSNNYAPCLNKMNFVVITFYIKLLCNKQLKLFSKICKERWKNETDS